MSKSISHRRGMVFVYAAIMVIVLVGIVSLAVDVGGAQLAKTELERAADAAARNGARFVSSGLSAVQAAAIDAADDNLVDGSALVLSNSNIQIGNWATGTKTFTNGGSPSNAVKVTTQRVVQLIFAKTIGMSTSTVHATSIAVASSNSVSGFIGLNGFTIKNNAFIASYNSGVTTNPSGSSYNSSSVVGSNGTVDAGNNDDLYGTLVLGPSGANSGLAIHPSSAVTVRSTNIPTPADPAWSPSGNPGGISQTYTVSSNTTLGGGTYWFTSLTVSGTLTFSAAATVYINGNADVSGNIRAYNLVPSNLKIYQLGSSRTFGNSGANGMDIVAQISAPGSDFSAKNTLKIRGSAIFKTMDAKNNAEFYYDETSGPATGGTSITTVK